jgi:hypothetical protein
MDRSDYVMARLDPAIGNPHQFANDAMPLSDHPNGQHEQYINSQTSTSILLAPDPRALLCD